MGIERLQSFKPLYQITLIFRYNAIRDGEVGACNVFPVKPGVVVADRQFWTTNEYLEYHGVKTVTLDTKHMGYVARMGVSNAILSLWRK